MFSDSGTRSYVYINKYVNMFNIYDTDINEWLHNL